LKISRVTDQPASGADQDWEFRHSLHGKSWNTAWITTPTIPPTTVSLSRMNCRSRLAANKPGSKQTRQQTNTAPNAIAGYLLQERPSREREAFFLKFFLSEISKPGQSLIWQTILDHVPRPRSSAPSQRMHPGSSYPKPCATAASPSFSSEEKTSPPENSATLTTSNPRISTTGSSVERRGNEDRATNYAARKNNRKSWR